MPRMIDDNPDFEAAFPAYAEWRRKLKADLEAAERKREVAHDDPKFDGTDAAHHAWWSVYDAGFNAAMKTIEFALTEKPIDNLSNNRWQALRDRVYALANPEPAKPEPAPAEPRAQEGPWDAPGSTHDHASMIPRPDAPQPHSEPPASPVPAERAIAASRWPRVQKEEPKTDAALWFAVQRARGGEPPMPKEEPIVPNAPAERRFDARWPLSRVPWVAKAWPRT